MRTPYQDLLPGSTRLSPGATQQIQAWEALAKLIRTNASAIAALQESVAANTAAIKGVALTQKARVAFTSIAASGNASVVVTWPTPFADTNYTAPAPGVEIAASVPVAAIITGKTEADITFTLFNLDTGTPTGAGTLDVIAIHD